MFDRGTQEAVAGLTAGMATTLVAHPLDFIKLRLQLDTRRRSQWESSKDIYRHLIDISQRGGETKPRLFVANIYRGLGPNLVGATVSWGMYFAFYRQYKNLILNIYGHPKDSYHHLKSWHYLSSAFLAGWSTSILTNPIWVLKTRMISTDRHSSKAYKSMLDGIGKIYRTEGILGFYRGLIPALVNVAQGAVQLSVYDLLKNYKLNSKIASKKKRQDNQRLDTIEYLYLSALSKMIATCCFYPLQVLRSRLQVQMGPQARSLGLLKRILAEEGIMGVYKGLLANLCRVVPATCLTFVVYEEVKVVLSIL